MGIGGFCRVLADTGQARTIGAVIHQNFVSDTSFFHKNGELLNREKAFWLKFIIRNNSPYDTTLRFFAGWHDYLYFYSRDNHDGRYYLTQAAGMMQDRTATVKRWEHFIFPIVLPANTTSTFYLKIINRFYREGPVMPTLFDNPGYNSYRLQEIRNGDPYILVLFMCLGMLLILGCFMMICYLQIPDKAYLYYALYAFGLWFYFCLGAEDRPYQIAFFNYFPSLKYFWWDATALPFSFYFVYILFTRSFLDTRHTLPALDKVLKYAAWLFALVVIINLILSFKGEYYLASIIQRIIFVASLVPLAIFYTMLFRKTANPLFGYYLAGSLSLLLCRMVAFAIFTLNDTGFIKWPGSFFPTHYLILTGTSVELLFFAAGLNYKNKLLQQEKTQAQEQLIRQLNKNKELQRRMNEDLEELVREQTTEILNKNKELETQRQIQMETEFNKRLTEIELKAIRAQINPHFIFNCLNSIQLFIMKQDFDSAQKYLADFSLLIRKTLDLSRLNFVSLNDEISYLNTYLSLEKMRFENKMEYTVSLDGGLQPAESELPSMLLQPYVENAVKHGMNNPRYEKGKLSLFFKEENNILTCLIEDNGIGIEKSKELKTNYFKLHQSSGMSLSNNRAELINKMFNTEIRIAVTDKESAGYDESGTIVQITIPQL